MSLRVATVQFRPEFKAKMQNLRKLIPLVERAATSSGADVLVLPELCVVGYSFMSRKDAAEVAEEAHTGVTGKAMAALAVKYGVTIVYGYVESVSGLPDLHNAQGCVSPDGSYKNNRKINNFGNDYLWSTPGKDNPPVVVVKGKDGAEYRVGLLICRDVRDRKNDKWDDFFEPGDADVVCLSAAWGNGGFPAVAWMDFVEENKTALVVSNRYGRETCNDFGEGGVCVIAADGTVQCEGLVWSQDCFVVGDITLDSEDE